MKTRSHIDGWLAFLIWLSVLILLGSAALYTPAEIPAFSKIVIWVIALLIVSFLLWIFFGTYYELKDDHLYCRSGPVFERIPYDKIKSIRLTQNILSSMALSAKRIEIRQYDRNFFTGTTYISPTDREVFFTQLRDKCKNLESPY